MAIGVVNQAIQLASSGQPDEALQLLQSLGLSPAQQGKIAAIFQGIKDVQRNVFSILAGTAHYTLLDLPPEDLLAILSALSWKDISTCALVCQGLYQTIQTEFLCKKIYQREFETYYPAQNPSLGFYHACKKGHTAQHNFLNGVYALRTLKMDSLGVCSLCVFDGKVISGSDDRTITIWDLKTGERLKTLRGHQGAVCSVAVFNGIVVSGSRDHTIKIWDLETGAFLNTLTEHQNTVSSLAIFNEKLVSGSWDSTIKIWDLKTGKCLNTLEGHDSEVCYLAVFNGKAVSSSLDRTIKIWDLETGKCHTFHGDQRGAAPLTIFNGKVVSGSWDSTIRIWDLESGACLKILRGCLGASSLAVFDGKVVAGSKKGEVKILDLETQVCLNTLQGHQNKVSSVAVSNGKVISGSWDGTIKVWDFTAEHSVVFTELAKLLRSDKIEAIGEGMQRLSKMPAKAQNEIQKEWWQILEESSPRKHELLVATEPELKAEAIDRYVARLTASENQPK
jgi:hypothetical protein